MNIVKLPSSSYVEVQVILDEVRADVDKIKGIAILGFDHDGVDFLNTTRLTKQEALWLSERLKDYALG